MLLTDVTLREGYQMPGRAFTAEEKVACTRTLDDWAYLTSSRGFPPPARGISR